MPTGTGKTETMLAVYAHQRIERLLVLVPSDALRDQLARKFESFGVLQTFGIVSPHALRPIVGQLKHGFSSQEAAALFALGCNVVVTTPSALHVSPAKVQVAFLSKFSHLFVDEAHHLGATTWQAIRDRFTRGKVVQFTATPFREDGRPLKGRIIYAFPLREAQRQGYFSSIDYISVFGETNPDSIVAETAVARLRTDCSAGFDHLLMARVRKIGRAEELRELYSSLAPEFAPVVIHSGANLNARRDALAAIKLRTSRIVICVDMLGEGFDLPQLKIAAIHDAHKSLGVTLQFVGRFARGSSHLGPATVVVSRPDSLYDRRLHSLYSEDADWNVVIRDLSEQAVADERDEDDFERAFSKRSDSLTLQMLEPKMSAVAYRTPAPFWNLDRVPEAFADGEIFGEISINNAENVAWFITKSLNHVRWGTAPELIEVSYGLFVLYLDGTRRLLFIHSSNTDSYHELLAKKICGQATETIKGSLVYRTMSGIARLVPTNVGVLDVRSYARRFSMHVGADVSFGFPVAEQVTKTQTNIFAMGYEQGRRVSIGASVKGRIWSYRIARSLRQWARWCDAVGDKLVDSSVNIDDILKSFIRPEILDQRPDLVVLAIELPWQLFLSTTEETKVDLEGNQWPLVDVDIRPKDFTANGPIRFDVSTPKWTVSYEVEFSKDGIKYSPLQKDPSVKRSRKTIPLSKYFRDEGLTFILENEAMLVHPSMLLRPDRKLDPFDASKIVTLDWTGINLRKESQGRSKAADTIQARVIKHLLTDSGWGIILDDDGKGEVADIVAIKASERAMEIKFVHCKYAVVGKPAARIDDLYEVCGQAQKSVRWAQNLSALFGNLIRRQKNQATAGGNGFSRGDLKQLHRLSDESRGCRPAYSIAVAQPGLSKSRVTREQLELLASTEVYLEETYLAKFEVIGSP
jgi:superfamily II DNA or RNA helicase